MEDSQDIDNEKSWKKHTTNPNDPKYVLKSSAPDNVDVWQFKTSTDNAVVRSVSLDWINQDTSDLKHCPTDYEIWEYWDAVANKWKKFNYGDANIICAWDATSKYTVKCTLMLA